MNMACIVTRKDLTNCSGKSEKYKHIRKSIIYNYDYHHIFR